MTNKIKNRGFTQSLEGSVAPQKQPKAAMPPFSAGFTLVETLVAILILVTAIAGPLTIASRSLIAATVAKDQVTAYYLAQDAIEYVRFVRDTNKLEDEPWFNGLSLCTSGDGTSACYIDTAAGTITSCTGGNCSSPIRYDTDSSVRRFSYTSGTNTIFRRSVIITNPLGGISSEANVTVAVSWVGMGGQTRTVTVQENMYDWQ